MISCINSTLGVLFAFFTFGYLVWFIMYVWIALKEGNAKMITEYRDNWIGLYFDTKKNRVYYFPVPFYGFVTELED